MDLDLKVFSHTENALFRKRSIAVKQRLEATQLWEGDRPQPVERGAAVPVAQREGQGDVRHHKHVGRSYIDGISPAHPQLAMQFVKLVLAQQLGWLEIRRSAAQRSVLSRYRFN